MKKLYISTLFLMQLPVFGQNINFQDQNFKDYLLSANVENRIARNTDSQYTIIDTNQDGEIQLSEALQISTLNISNTTITSTADLHYFSNLNVLTFDNNQHLSSINLTGFHSLWTLYFYNSWFNEINISNNRNLTGIKISDHKVQLNDFSGINAPELSSLFINPNENFPINNLSSLGHLTSAKYLYISRSSSDYSQTVFTQLDLTPFYRLEEFTIIANQLELTELNYNPLSIKRITLVGTLLENLNFSDSPLLTELSLKINNNLSQVILGENPLLNKIELMDNPSLVNLDLSNKPSLSKLDFRNMNFEQILFNENQNIRDINLNHTPAEIFNFQNFPHLQTLQLFENNLTSLDISSNPNLLSVTMNRNEFINMNLKNGNPNLLLQFYDFSSEESLRYICADSFNFHKIFTRFSRENQLSMELNDYCTFGPGGIIYKINGKSYFDVNNNEYDNNDSKAAFQPFLLDINGNISHYLANPEGLHNIATGTGTTIVYPYAEIPEYFNFTPTSASFTFPSTTNEVTQDFKVNANGVKNDLDVVLTPIDLASPGELVRYKLIYRNKGNTTQSGAVQLSYNDEISTFVEASLPTSSQHNGFLSWNFSDLKPFEKKEIIITLQLNRPTDTPSLDLNDILLYNASITAGTDETPDDNNIIMSQKVVNSFDPNDKTCLEGETISPEKVGEYVHYKIRFENLGNANAKNIVVRDEIDLDKFDISTLVPLDASHTFFTKVRDNNVAEFIFENIQLPFDDENNDGYVVFKIKTKPNLQLNDTFSNTAKIYFDYNHPIVTNTFTTAVRTLGTNEFASVSEAVSIYPNPVKDKVHFQSKESMLKAEVYDANGRLIFVSPVQNNTMDVKDLPKGNYIIKTYSKKGFSTQKIIKN